jgi:hypothetical protein
MIYPHSTPCGRGTKKMPGVHLHCQCSNRFHKCHYSTSTLHSAQVLYCDRKYHTSSSSPPPPPMLRSMLYFAEPSEEDLGFDHTHDTRESCLPSRRRVLLLITLSSTLLPLLTIVPAALPSNLVYFQYPKYGFNDFLRTLDPFVNFPILYLLFISARPAPSTFRSFLYTLSSVLYITGSVSHMTSAMFKHSIEDIQISLAGPPLQTVPPSVINAHFYMRNVWGHVVGHYLYAAGILCTSALTVLAHFHAIYPPLPFFRGWMLLYSSVLTGVLYALVAIQFPYGPLIGIALYAFISVTLGYLLWKTGELRLHRWASRPVPQFYAICTALACLITIIWTTIKGIKGQNLDS